MTTWAKRAFLLASALILISACALRIHRISQRSLWYDEASTSNISRGTFGETMALTRGEASQPIFYPVLLFAVEKISTIPFAVRLPALLASLLAVGMMLCFVRIPSVDPRAAALSALLLALSSFQIRYAQEVREYSISVLYAALLTYLFLSFAEERSDERPAGGARRQFPVAFFAALFAAPLVQYGLVLFGAAILAAMFLMLFRRHSNVTSLQFLTAALCLSAGCLLTFFLTLRYQWSLNLSYLKDYYYVRGDDLLHFIGWNGHNLLLFLLPGDGALWIAAAAFAVCLFFFVRTRTVSPLVILAFTSFGVVMAGGILRAYPFGPTRQCLFLAPVICLLAATSLVEVVKRFPRTMGITALAGAIVVILVAGANQIRSFKPYEEVEDIPTVLATLRSRVQPGDAVYVYFGAVPAVDYYLPRRDPRFSYGHVYHRAPEQYAQELDACIPRQTDTAWIVFSHVTPSEYRRMLGDLGGAWDVQPTVFAQRAALYQVRRRAPAQPSAAGAKAASNTNLAMLAKPAIERTALTGCAGESFWDWNLRFMRGTGKPD